ncbi:hypothetical protein OBV_25290 [Oscillibacter valericigenes Sjm18-20]|nr:hypothetical protein OBV_25290 [Oscillibacter valericigenes Sjm18-20]
MPETLQGRGYRKFIVFKIADYVKYVNSGIKAALLQNDLEDIAAGRKADGKTPYPEYIVINTDEPYAPKVIEIMKRYGHWGPEDAQAGERKG